MLNFVVRGFLVGLQGSVDSNSTVGKFLSRSQTCKLLRMGRHGNEVTMRLIPHDDSRTLKKRCLEARVFFLYIFFHRRLHEWLHRLFFVLYFKPCKTCFLFSVSARVFFLYIFFHRRLHEWLHRLFFVLYFKPCKTCFLFKKVGWIYVIVPLCFNGIVSTYSAVLVSLSEWWRSRHAKLVILD